MFSQISSHLRKCISSETEMQHELFSTSINLVRRRMVNCGKIKKKNTSINISVLYFLWGNEKLLLVPLSVCQRG